MAGLVPKIQLLEKPNLAFWLAVLGEFIATLGFVFIGCLSTIPDDSQHSLSARIVRISMAFGLGGMIMIKTFGAISGGHINPAVSFACFLTGKASLLRFVLYTVAQIVGGISAAAIIYGLTSPNNENVGENHLGSGVSYAQGVLTELILTCILVKVILGCVDSNVNCTCNNSPMLSTAINAVFIGLTIGVLHFAAIPVTGASMNPARSFGPALINTSWLDHWVYWVGPFCGAALAAVVHVVIEYLQGKTQESPDTGDQGNE